MDFDGPRLRSGIAAPRRGVGADDERAALDFERYAVERLLRPYGAREGRDPGDEMDLVGSFEPNLVEGRDAVVSRVGRDLGGRSGRYRNGESEEHDTHALTLAAHG